MSKVTTSTSGVRVTFEGHNHFKREESVPPRTTVCQKQKHH